LVVSKRVAARAVDRNRIKRIAREAFRAQRPRLPALDLALVARSGAAALERGALRAMCDQLLVRLGEKLNHAP
jgi:ribonuclease P protein component